MKNKTKISTSRARQKSEDIKNVVASSIALAVTFVMVTVMISQLASCASVDYAYSEAQWITHQIHFQENMDMPNCQWCRDYHDSLIP